MSVGGFGVLVGGFVVLVGGTGVSEGIGVGVSGGIGVSVGGMGVWVFVGVGTGVFVRVGTGVWVLTGVAEEEPDLRVLVACRDVEVGEGDETCVEVKAIVRLEEAVSVGARVGVETKAATACFVYAAAVWAFARATSTIFSWFRAMGVACEGFAKAIVETPHIKPKPSVAAKNIQSSPR